MNTTLRPQHKLFNAATQLAGKTLACLFNKRLLMFFLVTSWFAAGAFAGPILSPVTSAVSPLPAVVVAPTIQATNVIFTATTAATTTATWTIGNGTDRAVFMAAASSGSPAPVNAVYTANPAFKSGTQIGTTGWYCVYNGTGTTVNITALVTGTTYQVMVVEHNSAGFLTTAGIGNPQGITMSLAPTLSYSGSQQLFTVGAATTTVTPTSSNVGAQAYFSSAALLSNVGATITGLAVDAAGNLYTALPGTGKIDKIPAGGGTAVSFSTGLTLNSSAAVAVDAAGNVYTDPGTANQQPNYTASTGIIKIPAGGGTPVSISTSFNNVQGIAADGAGDVYVDLSSGSIIKIPAGGGAQVTAALNGNTDGTGMTVDAAGNFYETDNAYNQIFYLPVVGSGAVWGSGLQYTSHGIAVDAGGNVYVGSGNVLEIKANNASTVVLGGMGAPVGIAIDAAGYVYEAANGGIYKLSPSGGYYTSLFLPAGLTINSNTGVISGTPTTPTAAANYTVTAYNSAGVSTTAIVNIGVAPAAPTTQAINLTFTSTTTIATTASWTNGNGAARAVFMAAASSGSPAPVNLTAYHGIAAFKSGDQIGSTGWYCIYNGTGTTVNVTGLTAGTTYQAMVVEYNGTGNLVGYLTTPGTGNPAGITTATPPVITSFTPATGPVGTLVTINGTNLGSPTAFTIGGQTAIVISNTGSTLVAMVMPNAATGAISLTTAGGTAAGGSNFTVTATPYPLAQQGAKLVGTGNIGAAIQGNSVSVSADGNTAIVGGFSDAGEQGAAWIYTRSGGAWTQQGAKLVGTGANGIAEQGWSVALSADGNTAIVGGFQDNSGQGAVWIYTRSGGAWTQQGAKLVGTGGTSTAGQGYSVSVSADGNTAIVGGYADNSALGAAWVYTRSGGTWTQQGAKLVGTGGTSTADQGSSVSVSADGNTAIVGGFQDNARQGAAWVYTRSGGTWAQQGSKLVGTGNTGAAWQGISVSLSADGNTAIVGGYGDNTNQGAAWVYTRSGGTWAQQGAKLVGTGNTGAAEQGISVSLSADGNTAMVGGYLDNSSQGAAWVYTRSGGTWAQQGAKLVGTGNTGAARQGSSVSLSADGSTAMVGGDNDNGNHGAAWAYMVLTAPATQATNVTFSTTSTTATTASWTNGSGAARAVFMAVASSGSPAPVNFTAYNANAAFGTGGQIGSTGWYCVYNGTGTTVNITGLTATTTYQAMVVEYNGAGSNVAYLTTPGTGNPAGVTTLTPTISTTGTPSALSTTTGTASSSTTFNVSGVNLITGNLTVTAPAGFDVSADNAAWSASGGHLTIAETGTLTSTPVYIRLDAADAANSYSGNVSISGGGAATLNVAVPSSTVLAPPTTQAINLTFTGTTTTATVATWTNGNGTLRAVFMAVTSSGSPAPVNLTAYNANVAFGSGDQIGSTGWYCVYNGTGNTVNITGLTATTTYQAMVVEYNGTGSSVAYLTTAGTGNPAGVTTLTPPPPVITSFSPATGPAGTLVTVNGTNLSSPTAFTIGGQTAIVVSNNGSTLVAMVMPNAATGTISLTTAGGTAPGGSNFTVTATSYPQAQQGAILVGTGAVNGHTYQGWSVAVSADGNTAIVGGPGDNSNAGAAWIYTRSGGIWTQQGAKLVGTGAIGVTGQGRSVALSADGNTALVGGTGDNSGVGAVWIYTRSGGSWTQQGAKLVGTGANGAAQQGYSAALSADGNTAIVGGENDNTFAGAVWIYTRSGVTWTQQGAKLVGPGASGTYWGWSAALSADGNTAIVGGYGDNSSAGAAWIYTRSGGIWTQQGAKLVGTGEVGKGYQGFSVAVSADGNTAVVGGRADNGNLGAAWVYTRSGAAWTQQGAKLVGTGEVGRGYQGGSVAVSADGNTAMVGGEFDNTSAGAVWIFTRSGGAWTQQGAKLVGTGAVGAAQQGFSAALSADGTTAIVGGTGGPGNSGAAWAFTFIAPAVQAGNLTFTSTGTTTTTAGWANGGGTARAVFMAAAASGSPAPVNLTAYNGIAAFGSGDQIGSTGWYCVYNGTGTTVNITGLTAGTTYQAMVVEYNGAGSNVAYLITPGTGNPAGVITLTPTISTTGTPSALSTTTGTASSSTTFNVSGVNLTAGNLTVTAPAGFDVSADNAAWSASGGNFTIAETGTLASTPVYIRLDAADAANSYTGNVAISGGGAALVNVAIPSSTVATPTISTSGTPSALSTTAGTASSSTTFNVSGVNLITGNITVTAPAGFDVSADNAAWSASGGNFTIAETGTLASTPVYIRLDAADAANSYSGNVAITGGGAALVNVAIPSSTVATPTISTTGTPSALSTTTGTASSSTTFNVSGVNLITGNLTVTAPAGFDVSADNATWSASGGNFTIAETGTLTSTPVYIRLDAADAANSYSGNVAITGGGAALVNVAIPSSTVATPTISTTGTPSALSTTTGTASSSTTFNVSGINLITGNLTVTAPAGFDVSADNAAWSASGGNFTIAETGTLASTPVYIRLDAADAANSYSGNVAITGGGAAEVDVAIPSSTVATPTISTTGAPSALSTTTGTASSSTTFNVSGINLITGNLTVTAPAGFDVSADNAAWSASGGNFTIAETGTLASTPVYIRLDAADAANSYSGNVAISGGGAALVNVAIPSGTVSIPPTTVVSITPVSTSPTNATTLDYTVTFATALTTPPSTADFALTGSATGTINSITGSGTTYDVNVTNVNGNGTLELDMTGGSDALPTISNVPFTGSAYIIDQTAPTANTITFASNDANGTAAAIIGDQVHLSFAVSEAVRSPVVTIAGKAAAVSTTDNITYTATYTLQASDSPDGSGNVPYTIALTDLAGNTANYSELTTGVNVAFNNTPTIATTGTLQALSTTSGIVSASTSFSVSGFNLAAGILVTPPAGFEVSTDGNNFSSTVTIGAAGVIASTPVYVRLAAADAAGNYSGNIALTSAGASETDVPTVSSTVSLAPTTVTSITPVGTSPTNAATLDYTVTFAAALTTPPSTGDFTLTGAASGTVNTITTTDNINYDVNVTNVSGNGTLELDMTGGSDALPIISNVPFTGGAYTIDQTAPTVQSITATTPSNTNPTNASSVTYTVTFSEPVSGVDNSDFTFTSGGASPGGVNVTPVSSSVYLVSVSGISGSGTLRLDLKSSGTGIADLAGNPILGGFTGGDTYTFDHTAPTVSSITAVTPSNASPTNATSVIYTVTFSEAVTGVDATDFAVTSSGTSGAVTGVSGSGSTYTVTVSAISGNGTLRVDLNSGGDAITDATGNTLTSGFTGGDVYTIDNTAPSLVGGGLIYSSSNANANYAKTGDVITLLFGANEALQTPTVTIAGHSITAVNTGGNNYSAGYTMTSGDTEGRIPFNLTVTDLAGNSGNYTDVAAGDDITFDMTPPTVMISAPSVAGIGTGGAGTVTYTVTYADANFNTSTTPAITLIKTNTATGTVNISGSGTSYTVTISGITGSGTLGISVGAGYASDLAGNIDSGTGPSATFNVVLSSDATLSSLIMSKGALSPVFSTSMTGYTATVANGVTALTITPTAGNSNATILINNTDAVTSGAASGPVTLAEGAQTVINTVVTAQDGTTKTYTVTVTRAPSGNANLSTIGASAGPITPALSSGTSYALSVSNTTASMTIKPVTGDPNAKMKINGTATTSGTVFGPVALTAGVQTVISIAVTAQDGSTTKTYTLTVTRALSGNANLTSLKTGTGALAPTFSPAQTSYTESVINEVSTMTITPTATDANATIKVNGTPVTSGTAFGPVTLAEGTQTVINTAVTAPDGTTKTYTVTVTRAPSTNANLSSIGPSAQLTPGFSSATTSYTASVSNATATMTVKPVTSDPNAKMQINGTPTTSGTVFGPIALTAGAQTVISIAVMAQDGIANKTYTLTVTRAAGGADSYDPGISVTKPTETPTLAEDGIQVHQGISPNGDGINDFLQIDNISQYPDNKLSIMNRNGQLIYETRGYDNSSKVFDGHSNKNGQMQLPGTYFYQLDYTANGIAKHKTGFIVLKY